VAQTPGKVKLAAAAGGPALLVSDSITVASRFVLGPTAASLLTAAVGFISGLLTSFVTGIAQDARQRRREREIASNAAQATLAKVLSAEILANAVAIDSFLKAGQDPATLATGAYNSTDQASQLAWAYLERTEFAAYRARIDSLYRDFIPPYQQAVEAWRDAPEPKRAGALADVRRRAEELQTQFANIDR
jgi:hypothetical protein